MNKALLLLLAPLASNAQSYDSTDYNWNVTIDGVTYDSTSWNTTTGYGNYSYDGYGNGGYNYSYGNYSGDYSGKNSNFSYDYDGADTSTVKAEGDGWNVDYVLGQEGDSIVSEMRQTFFDQFTYALDITGSNVDMDTPECSVNSECDNSAFWTKCCSKTVLYHPASQTKDTQYRCMNRGVAQVNLDMTIGDMEVSIRCLNGAKTLAAGVMAMAALASTLF